MILSDKLIKYRGKIHFDPVDVTRKHEKQSDWKYIAMVLLEGDICEYYRWFVERRFGLKLNKPLRNAHISFLNDDLIRDSFFKISNEEKEKLWEEIKNKYDNKEIDVVLDISKYHSNKTHWYFIIPEEYRTELHGIRNELGLGRPFFGLHLSIGLIHPSFNEYSEYLNRLHAQGLIELY